MSENGWIGVDLDGTLATYDGWKGVEHIGEPVPEMLKRVRRWIAEGIEVRIVTARVSNGDAQGARGFIAAWCLEHVGEVLTVTNEKDFGMVELWDDRCVSVEANTGRVLGGNRR